MDKDSQLDSQLVSTLSPKKGVETTINSSDGIDMISHGSEFTINIMTPVGMKLMSKTKFIGYHSNNLILLEVPNISEDKKNAFFQEGFLMNVRAISQKGEGGIIQFRSQIMHILSGVIPMIIISNFRGNETSSIKKRAEI
ncbi:flagellar brake protein [Psychromonas sp. MME2]|uniref:flagellar brake protein n=1 Tax=Psychromonas sp. MME2 TaxID=3231033 RepID=UPI00339BE621